MRKYNIQKYGEEYPSILKWLSDQSSRWRLTHEIMYEMYGMQKLKCMEMNYEMKIRKPYQPDPFMFWF